MKHATENEAPKQGCSFPISVAWARFRGKQKCLGGKEMTSSEM